MLHLNLFRLFRDCCLRLLRDFVLLSCFFIFEFVSEFRLAVRVALLRADSLELLILLGLIIRAKVLYFFLEGFEVLWVVGNHRVEVSETLRKVLRLFFCFFDQEVRE